MTGLGEHPPRTLGTILKHTVPVWLALAALLALTVLLAYQPLGALALPVSLTIAAAKAALIAFCFMNLKRPMPLLRLAGTAPLLWIAFLFTLILADLVTRHPVSQPGAVEPRSTHLR
jgi:cytochrome c oxidase subunit 4